MKSKYSTASFTTKGKVREMIKFIKGYECLEGTKRTTIIYISRTKEYEFKISEIETEIEYRKVRLSVTEISSREIHTPRVVYVKSVEDMIKVANAMAERERGKRNG